MIGGVALRRITYYDRLMSRTILSGLANRVAGAVPLLAFALLAGCAALPPASTRLEPDRPIAGLTHAGADCRTGTADAADAAAIDPRAITLVNWNVEKGGHDAWAEQRDALAAGADVVLLQEAPLVSDGWRSADDDAFHAFAPGYETRRTPTGVLTISDAPPLVQCNLSAREPWLRSSKATAVTEYALRGRDDTLLVINIHAVNFTFGLGAFDRQLRAASGIIARHRGPVVFAGDFNTWRRSRLARLERLLGPLGLEAVAFAVDNRKRFLGQALDHVYVRGFDVVAATSYETNTSDHNPMRVWLSAP